MVLVVVTKGQQEALIPLAPGQKQSTGVRALNGHSADFSAADFLVVVGKHPIMSISCAKESEDHGMIFTFVWSVMVKAVKPSCDS